MSETSYRQSHLSRRGKDYDAVLSGPGLDGYVTARHAVLLPRLIVRHRSSGIDTHLDFACGSGRILAMTAGLARQRIGVDVSRAMLAAAKDKVPDARLVLADLTVGTDRANAALPPADLITAFRFFGNAEPALRDAAMATLRDLIRPDGLLIVNNHRNPRSLLARMAGGDAGMDLTAEAFRSLLRRHRFMVIDECASGAWMARHRWCQRPAWESALARTADRVTGNRVCASLAVDHIIVAKPI